MNNGDMPAMPIFNDRGGVLDLTDERVDADYLSQPGRRFSIGLTKREEFAKAAMVGILADSNDECVTDPVLVAREAVNYADALLAELAKTNEE